MSDQDGAPSIADKLDRLAALENDFQRVLEIEKLEAMAEFAAGAGHEINNPLTVISGRAQLLLREETDPERKHALALISAQAMRVYEMIADMMLFARPPRPERQPVELIKLIDELIADFVSRAKKGTGPICRDQPSGVSHASGLSPFSPAQTSLCRTGEPGPILIEADPAQLHVALRAICQNSFEALGSGGHIEIAVEQVVVEKGDRTALPERPEGCSAQSGPVPLFDHAQSGPVPISDLAGHPERSEGSGVNPEEILRCAQDDNGSSFPAVRIRISDDGPGIKPEERRHVFDPFYSARQAGRGLGLGLSKAWRIVTNHGGRIEVASEPGHGATFTITLPQKTP